MRAKKAFRNTVWGLVYEAAVLLCGLILPRLILTAFGSKYNGVTGAITQFFNVIAVFQASIAGVVLAALYKPLAAGDIRQISIVIKTAERFLQKVALIFIVLVLVLACLYPFLVIEEFDWLFTATLVLVMSAAVFVDSFFGQAYRFLLQADQKNYICYIADCVKIIANTAIAALLIYGGFGIHAVKLGASAVYVCFALFIYFYTRRKYHLLSNVPKDNGVIANRWDNFWQSAATFVAANTDIIILSIFTNVYLVSVYVIYNMVTMGVMRFFYAVMSGVEAAFGDMLAKGEAQLLKKNFRIYEQVVFMLSTFLFGVTLVMVLPFVTVYTVGVSDEANYIQPLFAFLIVFSQYALALRSPYYGIVRAAGHFKQTRNPAIIEVVINLALSVALVPTFGLVGVVAATVVAFGYRDAFYVLYFSRWIIQRPVWLFVKRFLLSVLEMALMFAFSRLLPLDTVSGLFQWVVYAVYISAFAAVVIVVPELIFYRADFIMFIKMITNIFR